MQQKKMAKAKVTGSEFLSFLKQGPAVPNLTQEQREGAVPSIAPVAKATEQRPALSHQVG